MTIDAAREGRADRPPGRLRAIGTEGVHSAVGTTDDDVEDAAALDVGERRRGLERGSEILVQRLDFGRVVTQLEHAAILAQPR